jgi:hypothetical protein
MKGEGIMGMKLFELMFCVIFLTCFKPNLCIASEQPPGHFRGSIDGVFYYDFSCYGEAVINESFPIVYYMIVQSWKGILIDEIYVSIYGPGVNYTKTFFESDFPGGFGDSITLIFNGTGWVSCWIYAKYQGENQLWYFGYITYVHPISYSTLETKYNELEFDYNILDSRYKDLTANFEVINNELILTKYLLFSFITLTVILLALTVYLVIRTRKAKRYE